MTPQRVLIIGSSGAGKSTLAAALSRKTGAPLVHLDREYWLPGWKEPDKAAWREAVTRLAGQAAWVMDGNYAGTFDIRMPRAQMIVFLDVGRLTCLIRVVRRVLRNWGQVRPDMGADCVERFDGPFMRYIWNFSKQSRLRILAAIPTLGAHAEFVHLRSRRECDAFLARFGPEAA